MEKSVTETRPLKKNPSINRERENLKDFIITLY